MKVNTLLLSALFIIFMSSCKDEDTFKTDVSDFEEFELNENSYWDGSSNEGFFIEGNKTYHNTYYPDWNTWSGFIYSNVQEIYYLNTNSIYAAFPSGGADESENYAVAHQFAKIMITFNDENGEEPRSMRLTNSTYTALSIKYGYAYAKKFGGRSGDDPDWFKLTITGFSVNNVITNQMDIFLADYRFEDNSQDYIIDKWENVDLTGFGKVKSLEFELSSSDAGTPLYFCLDNLKGRVHY
ncbi:MAG: DUF4465 domain-containing protein [Bacteroidales bacterium]|nr:DUF4465 domain-containing protein [Bacteroidales bacterium]